ncbi:hypothetical protein DVH05_012323 [Phytophthora capsici]|nr:hypothetical protein DVH05_012323 [Phytophthora capsici]
MADGGHTQLVGGEISVSGGAGVVLGGSVSVFSAGEGDDDASGFSGDVTLDAASTSGSVYVARGASSEGVSGGVTSLEWHGSCGGDSSLGGSVPLERDSASANSGSITVSSAAVMSASSSGEAAAGSGNADSGASGSLSAVSGVSASGLSGDVVVASGAVSDTDTGVVAFGGGSSGGSRTRRYSVVVSSGEIGVVVLSSGVYRCTLGGVVSLVTGGSTCVRRLSKCLWRLAGCNRWRYRRGCFAWRCNLDECCHWWWRFSG